MVNDERLITKALSGDRNAFEVLVESYWPVAERVARNILDDAQLAQDVAQDVFADIYVQRTRYQPRFSFHAYVAAIAKYKSIDLLRRRKELMVGVDERVREPRSPESAFIETMFRNTLYAAVERLPAQQRRILKAYALDAKSYREISAEFGISIAQVKITLHRIRKALRTVREDWER